MRSSSSSSTQVYEKKQAPFNESACEGNKKRISMNVGGGELCHGISVLIISKLFLNVKRFPHFF